MTSSSIRPIILCGGGGTRLWPLSTQRLPKQFLRLSSDQTMVRETANRVADKTRFQTPLAIGAVQHADMLRAELPEAELLLEPVGRNSAAAIAAACLKSQSEALLLVLPADHAITRRDRFLTAVEQALPAAKADRIVTFGICPDHPATGYGYIEGTGGKSIQGAVRFVEKPDTETAARFLETGRFFWNAGIFLFSASTMIKAFEAHAPDILESVRASLGPNGLDGPAFRCVRSQSIDYAVLEKASNIDIVPVNMGWSDLGDYGALHAMMSQESGRNDVLLGPVAVTEAQRILARSDGPHVAIHGVDNIAVVATRDGVLVTHLDRAADIKSAVSSAQSPKTGLDPATREKLGTWLFGNVLPTWAKLSPDPVSGGFFENLDASGNPVKGADMRGRVAPRQLFTYARAKTLGWNPDGLADSVIEHALDFLSGPARSPLGGWAHKISPDGTLKDQRRDLYDHAFVALAGAALASSSDDRGSHLALEAFGLIDTLFAVSSGEGWADTETGDGARYANPLMHLLEASLAWYEASGDPAALIRAERIALLFERHLFDPAMDAVGEIFNENWSSPGAQRIEPGHCYEWAFLLSELERVSGRDTASWQRRLVAFAERNGLVNGLAIDAIGVAAPQCRLWPQLERLRAAPLLAPETVDREKLLSRIFEDYLDHGAQWVWRDAISPEGSALNTHAPSSMLYHFMTAMAPLAD
ncbi:MAG TPA: hypothetical protein DF715_05240 [Oceanicaulis sp.]|nr:hypothetical protein [Oceanicaulis sp.]